MGPPSFLAPGAADVRHFEGVALEPRLLSKEGLGSRVRDFSKGLGWVYAVQGLFLHHLGYIPTVPRVNISVYTLHIYI